MVLWLTISRRVCMYYENSSPDLIFLWLDAHEITRKSLTQLKCSTFTIARVFHLEKCWEILPKPPQVTKTCCILFYVFVRVCVCHHTWTLYRTSALCVLLMTNTNRNNSHLAMLVISWKPCKKDANERCRATMNSRKSENILCALCCFYTWPLDSNNKKRFGEKLNDKDDKENIRGMLKSQQKYAHSTCSHSLFVFTSAEQNWEQKLCCSEASFLFFGL